MTVFEWREAPAADFAVIGDPVSHSLSSKMHMAAYRELGLPLTYLSVRVPAGEVSPAMDRLKELGYKGVNVTIPHKGEVIGWLKEVDAFALRVQSANTVRLEDRYGFNTDAPAFLHTLELLNIQPGTPTLVLGAGGAARAVVAALADEGYPLRIWNRSRARAEEMVEDLEIEASVWDEPELLDAMLVVNATASSLDGEPLPVKWEHGMAGVVAYDLAYSRGTTPFVAQAEAHGLRAYDGKGMLVMQGALAFEWWLEVDAPHDAMWDAVK